MIDLEAHGFARKQRCLFDHGFLKVNFLGLMTHPQTHSITQRKVQVLLLQLCISSSGMVPDWL
jgi:hypothetical protein